MDQVDDFQSRPVYCFIRRDDSPTGLTSFGYIYNIANNNTAIINGGAPITLSNNGPLQSISHAAETAPITITRTGLYLINYSVNITRKRNVSIAIAINSIPEPSTSVTTLTTSGNISGTTILYLEAGNIITLVNNSTTPIKQALAPKMGVQLTIVQIK